MGIKDWFNGIMYDGDPETEAPENVEEETVEETPQKIRPFRQRESEPTAAPAASSNIKVVLAKPESFEDGRSVADHLNAKRTVVLNLESTNREISRRLIDFLSGVAYANDGQLKRVANCTYIITPRTVDVMGDMILGELEGSGLFDNF